jgi:hypothetical protein
MDKDRVTVFLHSKSENEASRYSSSGEILRTLAGFILQPRAHQQLTDTTSDEGLHRKPRPKQRSYRSYSLVCCEPNGLLNLYWTQNNYPLSRQNVSDQSLFVGTCLVSNRVKRVRAIQLQYLRILHNIRCYTCHKTSRIWFVSI